MLTDCLQATRPLKNRNDNLDKYPDNFSLVSPLPKFPFLLFSLRLKINIFFVDMFCPGMPQRLLKQLVSISNLIGSGPCTRVEFACCRFPIDLMSEEGKRDHLVGFPACFPVSFYDIATMVHTWADVVLGLGSEKFGLPG